MKVVRIALRLLLFLVIFAALSLIGLLIFGTVTDYSPDPGSSTNVEISGKGIPPEEIDTILNFFNWNIGYGGLGKEMDFFYDGGKTVRAPHEYLNKYFEGILNTILSYDSIDFYLIQEIDHHSKRSYYVNQYDTLLNQLKNYSASLGINYNVKYVPLPITNGLGKVYSGLATYSKYQPKESKRYQYPGKFRWPTRIFYLDRCFLSQQYPLANGKELIVINTHNSAYDETGKVREQEMNFLREYVLNEYDKGNYIIAGGDFNQCPPGYDVNKFLPVGGYNGFIPPAGNFDLLPDGWLWCYDPDVPTNRHVETPLDDKTFKTLIDYYLISPNIELLYVKTIHMNFEYSDHQPVLMQVRLKQ
jgi:endonuclease/exonuclease/phosphatase family metal-dependent hydrolase